MACDASPGNAPNRVRLSAYLERSVITNPGPAPRRSGALPCVAFIQVFSKACRLIFSLIQIYSDACILWAWALHPFLLIFNTSRHGFHPFKKNGVLLVTCAGLRPRLLAG